MGDGAQEDHRYPFAGADNALVRLGVVLTVAGWALHRRGAATLASRS